MAALSAAWARHRGLRRPGRAVALADRPVFPRAGRRVGHAGGRERDRVVGPVRRIGGKPAPCEPPVAPQGGADEAHPVDDAGPAASSSATRSREASRLIASTPARSAASNSGRCGNRRRARKLVVARHQHDRPLAGEVQERGEAPVRLALPDVAGADHHVEGPGGAGTAARGRRSRCRSESGKRRIVQAPNSDSTTGRRRGCRSGPPGGPGGALGGVGERDEAGRRLALAARDLGGEPSVAPCRGRRRRARRRSRPESRSASFRARRQSGRSPWSIRASTSSTTRSCRDRGGRWPGRPSPRSGTPPARSAPAIGRPARARGCAGPGPPLRPGAAPGRGGGSASGSSAAGARGVADDQEQRARRRLLDHLQERVGAGEVQLVGAIDDADPVAGIARRSPRTGGGRAVPRRRRSGSAPSWRRGPSGGAGGRDSGATGRRPGAPRCGPAAAPGCPARPRRRPRQQVAGDPEGERRLADALRPPSSQAWCSRPAPIASRKARSAASWPRRSWRSRGRGTPGISPGSSSSSPLSGGIEAPPDEMGSRAAPWRGSPARRRRAALRVDHGAARRLGRRDGEEGRPQALVEAQGLGLEPVGAAGGGAVALARPGHADLRGQVEDQGQVRPVGPTTTRSRAASVSARPRRRLPDRPASSR